MVQVNCGGLRFRLAPAYDCVDIVVSCRRRDLRDGNRGRQPAGWSTPCGRHSGDHRRVSRLHHRSRRIGAGCTTHRYGRQRRRGLVAARAGHGRALHRRDRRLCPSRIRLWQLAIRVVAGRCPRQDDHPADQRGDAGYCRSCPGRAPLCGCAGDGACHGACHDGGQTAADHPGCHGQGDDSTHR